MKTAREIQQKIVDWAKHNFDYQDIVGDGMVEEIGEFCRARLKFKQKIRGHAETVPDKEHQKRFAMDLRDAIGDAIVFCMHWSAIHDAFLSFDTAHRFATIASDMNENEIIGHILQALSRVLMLADSHHVESDNYRSIGQKILDLLSALSNKRGWDFEQILNETWDEVKKRDWIKYPKTGLP